MYRFIYSITQKPISYFIITSLCFHFIKSILTFFIFFKDCEILFPWIEIGI